MHPRESLIVFTRYPQPGTTKTRLIPVLGPRGAAAVQRRMTEQVLAAAAPLKAARDLHLEVRHEGGSARLMRAWLGAEATYRRQGEGDLGRRMARACGRAMDHGGRFVVVIGSDIPGITTALLNQAFERLDDDTVVLGPAADGGYYLIGLSRRAFGLAGASLFGDMVWGTSQVLAETCRRIRQHHLDLCRLAVLEDVDRPQDLPVWERHKR